MFQTLKKYGVILTASDQTRDAFTSANKNAEQFANRMVSLRSILAGVSVVALGALVKGSIDAADRLDDLQKSTNLTMEELSGLNLLAKLGGTSLEELATSINRMSVQMGKAPEKFIALGITAKSNKEALMQFADLFNTLPDIQQRNALAMQVFGRRWEQMAPVLADGGRRIGEIIDQGAQYSGMTQEMVEQSKRFNDQMDELNVTLGATRTKLVGEMLPGMNEVAGAMREAAKEGGPLLTLWVGLGGAMANLLGITEVQKTKQRIDALTEGILDAQRQLAAGGNSFNPVFDQHMAELRKRLDEMKAELATLSPAAQNATPIDRDAAAKAAAAAAAFLRQETAKAEEKARELKEKKETDHTARLIAEQQKRFDALRKLAEDANTTDLESALLKQERQLFDLETQRFVMFNDHELSLSELQRFEEAKANIIKANQLDIEIATANNQANLINLIRAGRASQEQIEQLSARNRIALVTGSLQQIIGNTSQSNERMFKLSKAIALANALVIAPEVIMRAYNSGEKETGSMYGGIAYAAVATAAMALQIESIRSANYGGGGSVSSASGGAGGGGYVPAVPNTPAFPEPQRSVTPARVNVVINLGDGGLYSDAAVRALIERINEQIRDGATIDQINIS